MKLEAQEPCVYEWVWYSAMSNKRFQTNTARGRSGIFSVAIFFTCVLMAVYGTYSPRILSPKVASEYLVESCSNAKIATNVAYLQSIGGLQATRCPNEKWVYEWRALLAKKRANTFTFFEVGCNKATDAVIMLRLFTQNPDIDLIGWLRHTGFSSAACPVDMQLWNRIAAEPLIGIKKYKHYCFEPLPVNYETISKAAESLGYVQHGLKIFQLAMSSSDVPSTVQFPMNVKSGIEHIGIDAGNGGFNVTRRVQVDTVDKFARRHQLHKIDVLKIDTEGNDPRVLLGATQTLLTRKPSYVLFEYHSVGHWRFYALKDVIDFLDGVDYECFWATQYATLVRITRCWSSHYHTMKTWSNVVCYNREDTELGIIMERAEM